VGAHHLHALHHLAETPLDPLVDHSAESGSGREVALS
jgi:hypothetical protein